VFFRVKDFAHGDQRFDSGRRQRRVKAGIVLFNPSTIVATGLLLSVAAMARCRLSLTGNRSTIKFTFSRWARSSAARFKRCLVSSVSRCSCARSCSNATGPQPASVRPSGCVSRVPRRSWASGWLSLAMWLHYHCRPGEFGVDRLRESLPALPLLIFAIDSALFPLIKHEFSCS